jgi:hypothetical protein
MTALTTHPPAMAPASPGAVAGPTPRPAPPPGEGDKAGRGARRIGTVLVRCAAVDPPCGWQGRRKRSSWHRCPLCRPCPRCGGRVVQARHGRALIGATGEKVADG